MDIGILKETYVGETRALIEVAHPDFREELKEGAKRRRLL